MTREQAISIFRGMYPAVNFSDTVMGGWIDTLEGMVQTEILEKLPNHVHLPEEDGALTVPAPYDGVYPMWLLTMTYFWHGEYNNYENAKASFERELSRFSKYLMRMMPPHKECGNIILGHITFTPYFDQDEPGVLKWRNNGDLQNPDPFTIKGITHIEATEEEGGTTLVITYGQEDDTTEVFLPDGTDGISPTVTVNETSGGHTVTITDEEHPDGQTFTVLDGVSPEVWTFPITDGTRTGTKVHITDKRHPRGQDFDVMDGTDGEDGKNGSSIFYSSTENEYTVGGVGTILKSDVTVPSGFEVVIGSLILTAKGYLLQVKSGVTTLNVDVLAKIASGGAELPETTALLKGDGSGGAAAAEPGTDYQEPIGDLASIRSGAEAGATAYQKPITGIPASDMEEGLVCVFFGSSSSRGATVAKTVTVSGTFPESPTNGTVVAVKFGSNTASDPTLNVNSTGAYPMMTFDGRAMGGFDGGWYIFIFYHDEWRNIDGNYTAQEIEEVFEADLAVYRTSADQDTIDEGKVPTTRKVNGKPLSSDITLAPSDLGIGSVFQLKGSKQTYDDLPSSGNTIGDVWYVVADSVGYIWLNDGTTTRWEQLGMEIDLSAYRTKTEQNAIDDRKMSKLPSLGGNGYILVNSYEEAASSGKKFGGFIAPEHSGELQNIPTAAEIRDFVDSEKYEVKTATVTITVADWNGGTTVAKNVTGVTATSIVIVDTSDGNVECTGQGAGTLTFTAKSTPTSAVTVKVVIL